MGPTAGPTCFYLKRGPKHEEHSWATDDSCVRPLLTSSVVHAVYPGATWAERTHTAVGLNMNKLAEFRTVRAIWPAWS